MSYTNCMKWLIIIFNAQKRTNTSRSSWAISIEKSSPSSFSPGMVFVMDPKSFFFNFNFRDDALELSRGPTWGLRKYEYRENERKAPLTQLVGLRSRVIRLIDWEGSPKNSWQVPRWDEKIISAYSSPTARQQSRPAKQLQHVAVHEVETKGNKR